MEWLGLSIEIRDDEFQDYDPGPLYALVRQFVGKGMGINALNAAGESPIFAFFRRQAQNLTNTHSEKGTAAQKAALEFLDELGADSTVVNNAGETLLHLVGDTNGPWMDDDETKERSTVQMVARYRWALERGADPIAEDRQGRTCLDLAAVKGNQALLDLYG